MSIYAGVMSGTSVDGLDVAVVRFEGREERPRSIEVIAFRSIPYDPSFRGRVLDVLRGAGPDAVCRLDFEIGRLIGDEVAGVLASSDIEPDDVRAIGSHGQTVWHIPPDDNGGGATLQLGSAAVVAERTGIDVVSDFRSRDMAAGGHGAPLTAYTDRVMFTGDRARLIQNIGGIANTTYLPGVDDPSTPVAFDSGPGVALIDGAVGELVPGSSFDRDGVLATAGSVDEGALGEWLTDPYFTESPPKSTGRERFSHDRLRRWMESHANLAPEDVVATLTELTARTIADGLTLVPGADTCYVAGGGALNPALISRLRVLVEPVAVESLSALGVDPEAREAIAFALLARQHVRGIAGNAPWATGAAGPRILGSLTPA